MFNFITRKNQSQIQHKGTLRWLLLFLPSHEVWMIWHDSIKRHKRWSMLCHESNLGSQKFRIFCCTPFVMSTWILSNNSETIVLHLIPSLKKATKKTELFKKNTRVCIEMLMYQWHIYQFQLFVCLSIHTFIMTCLKPSIFNRSLINNYFQFSLKSNEL